MARYVVDGRLGAVCFGDDDPVLLDAWTTLVTITPPLQLTDLALFGGFTGSSGGDEETLAFVNSTDDSGELFQMSINLGTFHDDENQAKLTVAHEFSHVFTATPLQLDRSDEAFQDCSTYLAAEGCYLADSLMYRWIEQFWGDWIDQIDPEADASVADGEERCSLDPGFFGPYAASSPEEDFAESFSAFVFGVEASTGAQQRKLDFMAAQPGLVEFRDRADAAGWSPIANEFDPCG
ncbi:MAG: putative zinc-binding metallopeptidase [Ilumatobacteraceae bacterium]